MSEKANTKSKQLTANSRKIGDMVVELLKLNKRLEDSKICTAFVVTPKQTRDQAILARRIKLTQERYDKLLKETAKLV